jgi:hypothetical protein
VITTNAPSAARGTPHRNSGDNDRCTPGSLKRALADCDTTVVAEQRVRKKLRSALTTEPRLCAGRIAGHRFTVAGSLSASSVTDRGFRRVLSCPTTHEKHNQAEVLHR